MMRGLVLMLVGAMAPCHVFGAGGQAILKDAEQATHGSGAAGYELVDTYKYPGFSILQFNLPVLSHYSYLLVSGKEALVVDPGRDADVYVEAARKAGVGIKGVFLTHSHADFVAGHIELYKALNVPVYKSAAAGGVGYALTPITEGVELSVGDAVVRFVETPGHTPDGVCGLVMGKGEKAPRAMFTGDTLFVGSIGRPDLMGGSVSAAELAGMAYDSWTKKLSKLPDSTVVLPAHGAGSLCGAHLSDEPKSSIGGEKRSNPYLKHKGRSEFITAVLDGLPDAPQYFKHNAAMNTQGPEPVDWSAMPPAVEPSAALSDTARYWVVDLRDARDFAAGHVPNSVNIGLRGRLETWVGIMVPWGSELVLVGGPDELKEAVHRLHRVGYKPSGVLEWARWAATGMTSSSNEAVLPRDLYARTQKGEGPIVVDVRLPSEWMAVRIGQVLNLPINQLAALAPVKLDPRQPVVAVCNSAYRSSMAVGVLERVGFKKAMSLAGGSEAWIEAGLPIIQASKPGGKAESASPATPRRYVHLPERISAQDLKRQMADLPGSYDVVDIRSEAQFADYHLPGSRNVDPADLLDDASFLTGPGSLVIVDRDGSLAMAVAGILSQKTQRPVKALYGGLQEYWRGAELRFGGPRPGAPGKSPAAVPVAPAPVPGAPAAPKAPAKPKKKSAGC